MIRKFHLETLREAGATEEFIEQCSRIEARALERERKASLRHRRRQGRLPAPVEYKPAPLPSPPKVRLPTGVVPGAIPEDWRPDSTGLMMADQVGLSGADLDRELSQFRDYYLSEGKLKADWNASFRCWLRNYKPKGGRSGGYPETERDRTSREWREAREELRRAAYSGS